MKIRILLGVAIAMLGTSGASAEGPSYSALKGMGDADYLMGLSADRTFFAQTKEKMWRIYAPCKHSSKESGRDSITCNRTSISFGADGNVSQMDLRNTTDLVVSEWVAGAIVRFDDKLGVKFTRRDHDDGFKEISWRKPGWIFRVLIRGNVGFVSVLYRSARKSHSARGPSKSIVKGAKAVDTLIAIADKRLGKMSRDTALKVFAPCDTGTDMDLLCRNEFHLSFDDDKVLSGLFVQGYDDLDGLVLGQWMASADFQLFKKTGVYFESQGTNSDGIRTSSAVLPDRVFFIRYYDGKGDGDVADLGVRVR